MGEQQGRQLASKWTKTAVLRSHPTIVPHIPPTKRYSSENLRSMLNTHQMVVVKPVRGAGGHGVIKVSKTDVGYSYSYYAKTRSFSSFESMKRSLDKCKKKRAYLIQKGIRLATVNGRPIDYRVKYVKTEKGWVYRAIVGRIAKPGLFVTNICRGGTLVSAAQGIRMSLSPSLVGVKKRKMRELTVLSTQLLEMRFPGIGQLGFDYGIDTEGNIWIFEVNTRPQ
ncbi:YheC/YheD family protein [Paenibacillus sp. NEAU-GSW1]|uniref:YheC/YheD family protein n=1 Tax=Paenibacillus sp. NEAU-GSW1 TaxID=2682486 RepID=UPI0020A67648|nr:YheC/YheD family protein [Paenibacillus sp. NEAU-GSW1]